MRANGLGRQRQLQRALTATAPAPTTWAQARDAGVLVNAVPTPTLTTRTLRTGLRTGNCITKDGQNSPSANLPMNAHKHTGVADAAAATEYAAYGQLLALVSPFVGATNSRRDR